MPLASVQVETALLVLKIAFLVLLYLFIWRIVRSAARDLRLPQESMILSPQQASALLARPTARELGRLVVVESSTLAEGDVFSIDSSALTVGRGARQRPPARGRRVRLLTPRALRAAPRRRLRRGCGLHQRHLRQRDPAQRRQAARARRRRPDRRNRPEVRAMRIAQWSASSNVGRKRRHNEDSYVEAPPRVRGRRRDGRGAGRRGRLAPRRGDGAGA